MLIKITLSVEKKSQQICLYKVPVLRDTLIRVSLSSDFQMARRLDDVYIKGRGPGINSSQSQNEWEIQFSLQLSVQREYFQINSIIHE